MGRWVLTRWVPLSPGRYFEEIFNASGNPELVKKYGDWFTYDKNPRAQIFRRNQTLVRDLDSMVRLMRWVLGTTPRLDTTTPLMDLRLLGVTFFIIINLYIFFFHHHLHHNSLLAPLQVQQLPAGPAVAVPGL